GAGAAPGHRDLDAATGPGPDTVPVRAPDQAEPAGASPRQRHPRRRPGLRPRPAVRGAAPAGRPPVGAAGGGVAPWRRCVLGSGADPRRRASRPRDGGGVHRRCRHGPDHQLRPADGVHRRLAGPLQAPRTRAPWMLMVLLRYGSEGPTWAFMWRRRPSGGGPRSGVGWVEVVFAWVAPPLGRLVAVFVVPVPPRVRWGLGVALGRVLPFLLTPERCHVEVTPGAPQRLIAAAVDEVGAGHAVAITDERVGAVPLVHTEVGVELVGDGVPGHRPAHPRLHTLDVRLRRPRDEGERGVSGVQMGDVGDLIGHQGAAAASMVRPTEHAGLEEGAVDDQLTAALEQIEQARFALGSVELVFLLHRQPRHPPTLGGQRVTGAGQVLLLHEQLLARSLPLMRRYDRRCLHRWLLRNR